MLKFLSFLLLYCLMATTFANGCDDLKFYVDNQTGDNLKVEYISGLSDTENQIVIQPGNQLIVTAVNNGGYKWVNLEYWVYSLQGALIEDGFLRKNHTDNNFPGRIDEPYASWPNTVRTINYELTYCVTYGSCIKGIPGTYTLIVKKNA